MHAGGTGNGGDGAWPASRLFRLWLIVAGVLAVLFWAVPRAVPAQDVVPAPAPAPDPAEAPSLGSAPVRVENRRLFEVIGTEEMPAAQRAERINRRLQALIEREEPIPLFSAADVRLENGLPLITIGGEPVMVVTEDDAADVLATPQELALQWGRLMAEAVRETRSGRENPLAGAGILIRNSFRDLLLSAIRFLPRMAGVLLLWLLFWIVAKTAVWLVRTVGTRTGLDPNLRQLARAMAYYGAWAVGLIAILSTLGFETSSLIAALGISGFILGFAFKDILSHFLAGLMLLLGRQFRIGDQIIVRDQEGTVERIELRALHLRTYDNRLVIIPNAEVFNAIVTSNTASPYRRRDFIVGIDYGAKIEHAMQIALEAARGTPGVMENPEPDVLVDELAPSTVKLRVRFYMNSTRADYLKVGSDCMRRVKEAFDQEGISMPTEILTLVFREPEDLPASLMGDVGAAVEDGARAGDHAPPRQERL